MNERLEVKAIHTQALLVALADFVIAESPHPTRQSTHRIELDRAIRQCRPWRDSVQGDQK